MAESSYSWDRLTTLGTIESVGIGREVVRRRKSLSAWETANYTWVHRENRNYPSSQTHHPDLSQYSVRDPLPKWTRKPQKQKGLLLPGSHKTSPTRSWITSPPTQILNLSECALVSKPWVRSCRRHLFHTVNFTSRDVRRWFKTFPVPEESPAHYVRELCVWIGGSGRVPEEFFEYTTAWFTGVDRMHLSGYGYGGSPPSPGPLFWRLPQSTTSLTISTNVATLLQVQDMLAQLPDLDNLSLSGALVPMYRKLPNLDDLSLSEILVDNKNLPGPGAGMVLRGRFGGVLVLRWGYVDNDVSDMLLEVPSGLHFSEVQIRCARERLPPAVRLAEACSKILVKLSLTEIFHRRSNPPPLPARLIPAREISTLTPFPDADDRETCERSFDFFKFSNLREVNFGFEVGRLTGGLPWIPVAL